MIQYQEYKFSKKELVSYTLLGVVITSMVAYAFYKSIVAIILALPFSILILKYVGVYNKQKRLEDCVNTLLAKSHFNFSTDVIPYFIPFLVLQINQVRYLVHFILISS